MMWVSEEAKLVGSNYILVGVVEETQDDILQSGSVVFQAALSGQSVHFYFVVEFGASNTAGSITCQREIKKDPEKGLDVVDGAVDRRSVEMDAVIS